MAADDHVIETDVVRVTPDLTGFRKKLNADLKKAMAGVQASVKVQLVPDAGKFNESAKIALAEQALLKSAPTYKVKLVASGAKFNDSVKDELDKQAALKKRPTYTIKLVADARNFNKDATKALKGAGGAGGGGGGGRGGAGLGGFDEDADATRSAINYVAGLRAKYIKDSLKQVRNANETMQTERKAAAQADADLQEKQLGDTIRAIGKRFDLQVAGEKATARAAEEAEKARKAQAKAEDDQLGDSIRNFGKRFDLQRAAQRAETQRAEESRRNAEREAAAQLAKNVARQRKDEQYLTFQQRVNSELSKMEQGRVDDEVRWGREQLTAKQAIDREAQRLEIARLVFEDKIERQRLAAADRADRDLRTRRATRSETLKGPKLIALGQQGIQPMNLLYAGLIALIPALTAMASSAVQASTSLAALGAAGYGATLGIAALTVSFKGLSDLLALRKTVRAQQVAEAANAGNVAARAAKNAKKHTRDIAAELDAQDSLLNALDAQVSAREALARAQRDELKAQVDVNKARKQAVRDLTDMKQKVRDLQNQMRADTLSIGEAQQREQEVGLSYFATTLEKARAAQDVRDAVTRASDTRLGLTQSTQDLAKARSQGIEGSDRVREAKDSAAEAARSTQSARRSVTRANRGVTAARRRTAARADTAAAPAVSATTSAQANLDAELAKHSAALRELYHWLDANQTKLDGFRNRIEQATLPGFTKFLRDINERSKGASSTMDILVDGIAMMGGKISNTVAGLGKIAKSKWFKTDLAKLNTETGKSFDHLSGAALKMVKPLTQITVAAAPLLTKFSGWLEKLAGRFAKFIDKANANGSLKDWFDKAGESAKLWGDVVGNLATTLKNLFTLSLPSGDNLVQRFADFTKQIADWSTSAKGQAQITKFFDFFKNINYGDVGQLAVSLTELFVAFKAVMILRAGPLTQLFAAFATLITSHPGASAGLLKGATDALNGVLQIIVDHPAAVTSLLGILGAMRLAKKFDIGIKLPGVDNLKNYLTAKFKPLEKLFGGSTSTGTMTVHAGVVNIYGGGGVGGKGGKGGGKGGVAAAGGGMLSSGLLAAVIIGAYAMFNGVQARKDAGGKYSNGTFSKFFSPVEAAFRDPSPGNIAKALLTISPAYAAGFFGTPESKPKPRPSENQLDKQAKQYRLDHPEASDADVAEWRREQARATPKDDRPARLAQDIKTEAAAYDQLNRVAPTAAATQQLNNKATADAFQPLQDYVKARKESTLAAYRVDVAEVGAAKATQNFNHANQDSINTLTNTLTNLGWTDKAARTYAESLYRVPDEIKTDVKQPTMKKVLADTQDLWDKLEGVDGNWVAHLSAKGGPEVAAQLLDLMSQQYVLMNPTATDAQIRDERRERARMITAAEGGYVRGPGTPTSDSIPAMLSRDEYVQPAHATAHYGVAFMDKLRRHEIPREVEGYAKGGAVTMPFPLDVSQTQTMFPGLFGDGVATGDVNVAETAERTARAVKATNKQLLALIEAGLVESGLHNLPYGDRDSVGFLQQRASWGSRAQRMNVAEATRKFIRKAKGIDSSKMTAGQLAQAVQVSAFPGAYDKREADAAAVLNRMAPFLSGYVTNGGGGTGGGLVAFGRWLQAKGYDVSEHPAFGGVRGRHADGSQHYRGTAIDVNHGAGTSAREQAYLRAIIPEAHKRGFRSLFMVPDHYDHAHFDLGAGHKLGGPVGARAYDTGGSLPPGYTLAFNGTGRTETVRTAAQERRLHHDGDPVRLDRRDIVAIAHHLGAVLNGQSIAMDGRKVAEVTNKYTYLPAGV